MKISVKESDMKLWAPCCWYLLHILAYQMESGTVAKPDRCRDLFRKLGKTLPCPMCKEHFKKYIKHHPIKNDTDLVQWTRDYHNDVNKLSKKPILSAEEVHQLFYVKNNIPVNHKYIHLMLQIFYQYHQEEKSLDTFNDFFKLLRKVYPCRECRLLLKKYKNSDFKTLFKIIKGNRCNNPNQTEIGNQAFKIQ